MRLPALLRRRPSALVTTMTGVKRSSARGHAALEPPMMSWAM